MIKTNHNIRQFVYGYELPEDIKKDFMENGQYSDSGDYLEYKGIWYSIDDFMLIDENSELSDNWDGYCNITVWNSTLIKIIDSDHYKIGTLNG